MTPKNPGRRGGLGAPTAAGVLLALSLAGCAGGPAGTSDGSPPPSASSVASPAPTAAAPLSAAPVAAPPGLQLPPVLGASAPVTLNIDSIGVRTDLLHLGLEENGSLKVPQDTGNGAPASWYDGSPTPGERGPSVMLGHVNALGGHKGVFADLRETHSRRRDHGLPNRRQHRRVHH